MTSYKSAEKKRNKNVTKTYDQIKYAYAFIKQVYVIRMRVNLNTEYFNSYCISNTRETQICNKYF